MSSFFNPVTPSFPSDYYSFLSNSNVPDAKPLEDDSYRSAVAYEDSEPSSVLPSVDDSSNEPVADRVKRASDPVFKTKKRRKSSKATKERTEDSKLSKTAVRREQSRLSSKAYRDRKAKYINNLKAENERLLLQNQIFEEMVTENFHKFLAAQQEIAVLKQTLQNLQEWEKIKDISMPLLGNPELTALEPEPSMPLLTPAASFGMGDNFTTHQA